MRFDHEDLDRLIVDTRSLGQTGLQRSAGIITEETLPQLDGQRGMRIYRDMADNDSVCNAIVFAVQQLVRTTEWRVTPASQAPYDREAAEFLEQCMHDMEYTWLDHVCEFMSMAWYGFSVHELVYKQRLGRDPRKTHRSRYRDARVGWRYIPIRSQDSIIRWHFDYNGDVLGFEQQAPPDWRFVSIPMEKCVHFRTFNYKNSPVGRSIFRGAYEDWYFKRQAKRIESIGMERDLAGLPAMGVPPELLSIHATEDQKNLKAHLMKVLKNIRNDEQGAVMYPLAYDENGNKIYDLSLMSTGGSRQFDTDKIIQRYDHRIALAAMADFMLLGASGSSAVGSNAMHRDKTSVFAQAVKAFIDVIAAELNRRAVPALMDQNAFRMSDYPKIEHSGLDDVDMKDLGDYLSKLATTGIQLFPNPELERAVLEVADLPAPIDPAKQAENDVQPMPRITPSKVTHIDPPEDMQGPEPGSAPRESLHPDLAAQGDKASSRALLTGAK
jgi:hypothetical protein